MATGKSGKNIPPMLVAAAALAFGATLSGCSTEPEDDRVAYCVDENDKIIDEKYCDADGEDHRTYVGGGHSVFIWYGNYPAGLPMGTNVTTYNNTTVNGGTVSGTRVSASDPVARANAGLPSNGKVATGKTGGIGTGKGAGGKAGGGTGGKGGGAS